MKKIISLLSGLMIMGVSIPSFAAETFTVNDGDQSKKIFLDTLFGPLTGAGESSEFSSVIGIFNAAMLLLAGIMVAYTLVAGTMSTAHDGEMLGKRWSSLWIPIRTSVGAAMIFPLTSGFCAIQYIVMWIALQGVGFADKLVEGYINKAASPTSQDTAFAPPTTFSVRRQALEKMLIAQTCETAMGNEVSNSAYGPQYGDVQITPAGFITVLGGISKHYGMGFCGSLSLFTTAPVGVQMEDAFASLNATDFADSVYQVNSSQVQAKQKQIKTLAQKIVTSKDDNDTLRQEVATSLDQWAHEWEDAVNKAGLSKYKAYSKNKFYEDLKRDGWLTFGGWYMELARVQDVVAKALTSVPSVNTNVYEKSLTDDKKEGFWARLFKDSAFNDETKGAIKRAHDMASFSGASPTGNGGTLQSYGETSDASSYLVKWFVAPDTVGMFSNDYSQNPVMMAQNLGRNMVGWGTAGYVAGMAAIILMDRDIGGFTLARLGPISPLLTAIAGTIIVTGAFLSVYPPMLPYVLWIGAILGWVVFLVEAIIAAPLWAVAQIAPDGDGVVGKGGQGYMLVLSLFMRPALMVLGFISAIIVMKPMGVLINSTFLGAFLSGASPSWYGIVTMIMGCILYATLMVSVINKVFALIHVIPDKILRWMGGGANDLGEAAQGVEGTTAGKVMTGAGAASTLGQAGVAGAQSFASMSANRRNQERGLKQQELQTEQNRSEQHRDNVNASNEEADDALRGMAAVDDTSAAGERLFDAQASKALSANDKNSVNSMKGAISAANASIKNVAAKGKSATPAERQEAAAAQAFLDSTAGVNTNNAEEARGFMQANAARHAGTSWGNIMAQSNKSTAYIQNSMQSLRQIRENKKAQESASNADSARKDVDPAQGDLFQSSGDINDHS